MAANETHIGDQRLNEPLPGIPDGLVGARNAALKASVGHSDRPVCEPGVCRTSHSQNMHAALISNVPSWD